MPIPAVRSARLLLQEKVPENIVYSPMKSRKKSYRLRARKWRSPTWSANIINRIRFCRKTHILSNGNYSVVLTDRGTGYSKNKNIAVTRWREDSTHWINTACFSSLRDVRIQGAGLVFRLCAFPICLPEKYKVTFTSDKVHSSAGWMKAYRDGD